MAEDQNKLIIEHIKHAVKIYENLLEMLNSYVEISKNYPEFSKSIKDSHEVLI